MRDDRPAGSGDGREAHGARKARDEGDGGPIRPPVSRPAPREARVLGGSGAHPASDSAWDREPLATLREERRLFRRWVPLSLIVGLLLGLALLRFGLQVALIGMLLVQTGGLLRHVRHGTAASHGPDAPAPSRTHRRPRRRPRRRSHRRSHRRVGQPPRAPAHGPRRSRHRRFPPRPCPRSPRPARWFHSPSCSKPRKPGRTDSGRSPPVARSTRPRGRRRSS